MVYVCVQCVARCRRPPFLRKEMLEEGTDCRGRGTLRPGVPGQAHSGCCPAVIMNGSLRLSVVVQQRPQAPWPLCAEEILQATSEKVEIT